MSNNTSAFGLAPYGGINNEGHGGVRPYYIPASYDKDVFIGDLVVKDATANTKAINGHKPGSLETVKLFEASGTQTTGVVIGFEPINPYTPIGEQGAKGTERVVYVSDDPNALYTIRANADSIDGSAIGKNADIEAGTGSKFTGLSGTMLDGSTAETTATLPLKIIGIAQEEGEDEVGAYAKLIVSLNTSTQAPNTAGI